MYIAGQYVDLSDFRAKSNIQPLHAGLDELLQLEPVSFTMVADPGQTTELGLVAQDVREVLPDLVFEGEDGTLSMTYQGLIPVLINAIQEQQAEINALKSGGGVAPQSASLGGLRGSPWLALGLPVSGLAAFLVGRGRRRDRT